MPEAGNFLAEIYYTCPASDVGSTIEVSFLDAWVQAKISHPNDPPLAGKSADRVERTESYVKDFKPLKLGTIHLGKGRGKFTMQAVEIKAKQVADIRYLILTRL